MLGSKASIVPWKFYTNLRRCDISFTDCTNGLTAREQKALEHSWAKTFAEDIFPAIDEKSFSILYSANASRPNTPVNICIGALIIGAVLNIILDPIMIFGLLGYSAFRHWGLFPFPSWCLQLQSFADIFPPGLEMVSLTWLVLPSVSLFYWFHAFGFS